MSAVKFIFRLAIGLALITYLLLEHEVAVDNVFGFIKSLPILTLLGAVGIYLAGQLISAYRWASLSTLGGKPARFGQVWPIYFSGMFVNIFLPTSIGGDVIRVVSLGRRTGSKTAALASVFMDRNVGLSALLLVGLLGSIVIGSTLEITLYKIRYPLEMWPLFVFLILGYVGANLCLFNESFGRRFTAFLERIHLGFIAKKLDKLHDSLRVYHQPLYSYIGTFLLSVLYQLSEIGCVWLLATALDIPGLSPWVYFAIVPFQAVASLLPITFSGMGVREGIFCAVFMGQAVIMGHAELVSIFKDKALALSLMYFSVVIISSMIGGVVYMLSGIARPSQSEVRDVQDSDSTGELAGSGQ